jgi:hypothetical protein
MIQIRFNSKNTTSTHKNIDPSLGAYGKLKNLNQKEKFQKKRDGLLTVQI